MDGTEHLIGDSEAMSALRNRIRMVAPSPEAVLVTGPSGSGKELVAAAIHAGSLRGGAFVPVNCAAIPADLLESEFFGHERGAFSGALAKREGHVAAAAGGTLFLDEIADLPLTLQAKLLRLLDGGGYMPVGSSRVRPADVRIVAATHRDLVAAVREGHFREDLFFRLSVLTLATPSLADRIGDLDQLMAALARAMRMPLPDLSPDARAWLAGYAWPGNVRQLRAFVVRAGVFAAGVRIEADLAAELVGDAPLPARSERRTGAGLPPAGGVVDAQRIVEDVEWRLIEAALQSTDQVVAAAARALGMKRSTLIDKIARRRAVVRMVRAGYRARSTPRLPPRPRYGRGLHGMPLHRAFAARRSWLRPSGHKATRE